MIDHADELGVDPNRIALMGHSAGAHLVSIVGTSPALLNEVGRRRADIACVVSLDTLSYDLLTEERRSRDEVLAVFGTDEELLVGGSPLAQVRAGPASDVAEFLVVARGSRRRLSTSEEFADALVAAGGVAEFVDVSPSSHRDVSGDLGVVGESVITPVVTDFLARCL